MELNYLSAPPQWELSPCSERKLWFIELHTPDNANKKTIATKAEKPRTTRVLNFRTGRLNGHKSFFGKVKRQLPCLRLNLPQYFLGRRDQTSSRFELNAWKIEWPTRNSLAQTDSISALCWPKCWKVKWAQKPFGKAHCSSNSSVLSPWFGEKKVTKPMAKRITCPPVLSFQDMTLKARSAAKSALVRVMHSFLSKAPKPHCEQPGDALSFLAWRGARWDVSQSTMMTGLSKGSLYA